MNLHGYLAASTSTTAAKEALDFTNIYFYTVVFNAIQASNKIAIERGSTFSNFENSTYASGEYFEKYVTQVWEPKNREGKGALCKIRSEDSYSG